MSTIKNYPTGRFSKVLKSTVAVRNHADTVENCKNLLLKEILEKEGFLSFKVEGRRYYIGDTKEAMNKDGNEYDYRPIFCDTAANLRECGKVVRQSDNSFLGFFWFGNNYCTLKIFYDSYEYKRKDGSPIQLWIGEVYMF